MSYLTSVINVNVPTNVKKEAKYINLKNLD